MKTPLALPWERIPRLESDVRIKRSIAATLGCGASVILGRDLVLGISDVATVRTGSTIPRLMAIHTEIHLETAVNTISHEYLLEFTSEYDIPETLRPALPGPEDRNNRFFWVDESVFLTVVDWRSNAPKDGMPATGTYSVEAVRALDTHRTPIQKQPEMLLCLVGLSRGSYLGDEVYPTFLHDNDRDMDLFSLIRSSNPTKVKVGSRPRAPHEVPLLTLTANRVIEMDDPATASESSGVPPTIERSPLDFSLDAGASDQGTAAPEVPPFGEVPAAAAPKPSQVGVAAADPPAATKSRKRGRDGADANAPRSHCEDIMPILGPPEALMRARALLPYSWAWLLLLPCLKMHLQALVTQIPCVLLILRSALRPMWPNVVAAEDPESKNASSPTEFGSPGGVYRPEWGVTNGSLLDTPEACQDLVDHVAPPGYFSELRHMFEQEAKLLRKSMSQVARQDKRIEARELEIKNVEALLETEADIKRAAEDKSAGLIKELVDMRAQWVVGHGLRLAMMKCAESLEMRQAKKKFKGKSKKHASTSELENDVVDYSSNEADRKRKNLNIKAGLNIKRSGSDSSNSLELDTKSIKRLISKLEKKVKKLESDEESVPKKLTKKVEKEESDEESVQKKVADKPSSVVVDKVDVVKDNINVVADKASDALKNKRTGKGKKPVVGKDKDKPKNITPDIVKEKFKPNLKQKRKNLNTKAGLNIKRSGSDSSNSLELDTKSIKRLISKLEKKVKKQESDEESVPKN
uniref:Transposase (Putative), gypsy type n=1 Tax=Tanacetum cinerariifolium TaxID=118510 RepID=A0A6L2NSI5_TANCI|nr:transposase (putative), gypsy type [Tanacetum cinerariifolium]